MWRPRPLKIINFVLTGQWTTGKGHQKGDAAWIDASQNSKSFLGASGFFEIKLPWILSSIFGRYDWFDGPDVAQGNESHRIIAGYALHFLGRYRNMLVLDFDYSHYPKSEDQWHIKLTLQVKL